MPLTDMQLRSLPFLPTGQKDYPDRDGMFVRVGKARKTFMCVIRQNGRRSYVTLGHYPDVNLSKARSLAKDKQAEARLAKAAPITMTFKAALELFTTHHIPTMRPGSQAQATRLLTKRFSQLHPRRLPDLTTPELATALDAIAAPGEKLNASIYLRAFLTWCFRRGYIDINPIARLPAPQSSRQRERVLDTEELAKVWNTAHNADFGVYGAFIQLLLLTAQRKGQWYAFDPSFIHGDSIVFPASVMKGNRTHILPLTPAIAQLIAHHPFGHWNETNRKRAFHALSGTSGWTLHDLRRTTATRMAELGIAPHIIERTLAHSSGTISGVAAIYNRATYLPEMKSALLLFEERLHSLLAK